MNNPFANPDNLIDYGKKGKDIPLDANKNIPLTTPTLDDVIDLQPALDGKKMSQKEWCEFYNKQEGEAKGKRMILASDIYEAGKSGSKELLASLRNDFKDSIIVSGTRSIYNKNTLSGIIVHDFNSTVAKPIKIAVAEIPVYHQVPIKDIVVEGKGLAYVQTLFNTTDDKFKIITTLETLSGKAEEDIRFSTPNQNSRKNHSECAVGFDYVGDWVHVDGDDGWDDYSGLSRGVLWVPRSGVNTSIKKKGA